MLVLLVGAGFFIFNKEEKTNNVESAIEQDVRTAIEKVIVDAKSVDRISPRAAINSIRITQQVIALDFNQEVASHGQAAFEDFFRTISNVIHPIIQGDGIDSTYSELEFIIRINGEPLETFSW